MLELQELFDGQFIFEFLAEKVSGKCRIDALCPQRKDETNFEDVKVLHYYLERVSRIGMIPVSASNARLMAHQSRYLFKLLAVYVSVAVQIEHAKRNLEVSPRG